MRIFWTALMLFVALWVEEAQADRQTDRQANRQADRNLGTYRIYPAP